MVTNDEDILRIKHKVIEEVARLAWKGDFDEENYERIAYKLIPGPKATYRCCIYKERELIRQRIRLALGKNPTPDKPVSRKMVHVLEPACDECPISSYIVTDNCRSCMGKACYNSCQFGAISVNGRRAYIDPSKCKECGKCAAACPYSAIAHLERPCKKACPAGAITYDENGICLIDEAKCIECGHCIHACPFGAISSKSYVADVILEMKAGRKIYAMCAPATEGQFGPDITFESIRKAVKEIGFEDMVEVGLGGDMTAAYEAEEWEEAIKEGKKMTTSCCPAFVNLMRNEFPEQFKENMSQTISPMCAVSRYLKALHPGCVTVFIGPCIAKKSECRDESIEGNADYVLTFGEFRALLRSKDVELLPADNTYQEASTWGKRFANSGGVANAVLEVLNEKGVDTSDVKLCKCSGGQDCRVALLKLKSGRLEEQFIEGMMCSGGCVGGPSKHKTEAECFKAREGLIKQADGRKVLDNLKQYPMDKFSMHRDGN
ncbi:MAG: 4Fe-4S dicluster domain-containing protein [Lachnospiraceae bacterium]|nr:4Fe-4S dicluster domain-containing protein [Lachnospiraceae bacterium]MBQ8118707.1 4Fe-4S dicluster domain-containing protein [Lachnospiraceae bacterium]MBR1855265.1 4Fe-4S dicluster domain-containing protein [Lachnospiraceae bacterium]